MSEKVFVGIDASLTGTGLVILNEKLEILEQVTISTEKSNQPHDIEHRLILITDSISTYLSWHNSVIRAIYIEEVSFGSKGQKIAEMAALNYFIRIFLYRQGHTYKAIPPTQLKKFVTGTGKCQKNLMLLKCFKRFGVEFSDDNICDAYCLARLAYEDYNK